MDRKGEQRRVKGEGTDGKSIKVRIRKGKEGKQICTY